MSANAKQYVYLGIPGSDTSREEDTQEGITNAYLLAILEAGREGIMPPRPVLRVIIEENKDFIAKEMAKYVFYGDKSIINKLCLYLEAEAREYITQRDELAPNKPSTILKKGSDRPLIDTGQLVGAIRCWEEEE